MENGRVLRGELLFKHPFSMIVGGASASGKTEWVRRFIQHHRQLIEPSVEQVLYCYGVFNPTVLDLQRKGVDTMLGLPTEAQVRNRNGPLLLILDDLMIEAKSDFLDLLFTRGCHHWGVSVVFVTQNLFEKSLKTARNNAHYIVLLRNPSGQLQIRNLGTQLFPRQLDYFMDAYKKATAQHYGYLLIDMHPKSRELLRLRTHIFPDEQQHLFIPVG